MLPHLQHYLWQEAAGFNGNMQCLDTLQLPAYPHTLRILKANKEPQLLSTRGTPHHLDFEIRHALNGGKS
jgi:hypothetical protein